MSNRKHRPSREVRLQVNETKKEESASDEGKPSVSTSQQSPTPSSAAKSPFRMMFLLWGLPLIIFVIIAVIRQCE